jgi:hypothetical protein
VGVDVMCLDNTLNAHHGPWTFITAERVPRPLLRVPVAYYKIPPGHLKKPGHGHKHKKHKGDDSSTALAPAY